MQMWKDEQEGDERQKYWMTMILQVSNIIKIQDIDIKSVKKEINICI